MGFIDGLFIAEEDRVKELMGKTIDFGEVLGKYSDISVTISPNNLGVFNDHPGVINSISAHSNTLCGYNPFEYIDEDYS
jgi:hypothetical protein